MQKCTKLVKLKKVKQGLGCGSVIEQLQYRWSLASQYKYDSKGNKSRIMPHYCPCPDPDNNTTDIKLRNMEIYRLDLTQIINIFQICNWHIVSENANLHSFVLRSNVEFQLYGSLMFVPWNLSKNWSSIYQASLFHFANFYHLFSVSLGKFWQSLFILSPPQIFFKKEERLFAITAQGSLGKVCQN